jgi:Cu(I)-responsive transcriptional regulator
MKQFTIGKLAQATGVNIETIRYYERSQVISEPLRSDGNYRVYDQRDAAKLRFIKHTRELGFSLEQVRAMLSISNDQTSDCTKVNQIALEHLRSVDQKIADLSALREKLASAVSNCHGGQVADCRILEAFA